MHVWGNFIFALYIAFSLYVLNFKIVLRCSCFPLSYCRCVWQLDTEPNKKGLIITTLHCFKINYDCPQQLFVMFHCPTPTSNQTVFGFVYLQVLTICHSTFSQNYFLFSLLFYRYSSVRTLKNIFFCSHLCSSCTYICKYFCTSSFVSFSFKTL
jgi:hypothetical protein